MLLLADTWLDASSYYILSLLLVILCICAWALNFIALPGNWIVVAAAALFAWLAPHPNRDGLLWWTVGAVTLLAMLGELIEFAAGAFGAKKLGGSRRGMILAMVAAMIGSIVGAMIGVPVPLIGPLIGAVLGGALGAFAGAYAGESWKGLSQRDAVAVSTAALVGRVLGTVGKILMGMVMLVVMTVDLFVDFS